MNALEKLREVTTIVADSGDIKTACRYNPQDATTNPSLIMVASKLPNYESLIDDALQYAIRQRKAKGITMGGEDSLDSLSELALDKLIVNFGCEYLKRIPGRVSTEVNAQLSYDTAGTIAKARHLVKLYEETGITRDRVLIKIASTWEGILAARQLELEGIHCNLTLLFSLVQAAAAAEAGATLISPFVGRILDWHRRCTGKEHYSADEDPGVQSVKKIYYYLKKFGFKTIVMGASFRNVDEILGLTGIDLITISPKLLEELASLDPTRVPERQLCPKDAYSQDLEHLHYLDDERMFREHLAADEMATDLLADGIKRFEDDARHLEAILQDRLTKFL